jgi:hypothetical protein
MSLRIVKILVILLLVDMPICAMTRNTVGQIRNRVGMSLSNENEYDGGDDRRVIISPTRRRTSSEDLEGLDTRDVTIDNRAEILRPEDLRQRAEPRWRLETSPERRVREKRQFENGIAWCCGATFMTLVVGIWVLERVVKENNRLANVKWKQD